MSYEEQMKEINTLYNIKGYSPLVEIIDRKQGYLLLKNLVSLFENEMYSVAVEHDVSKSPIMPNKPNNTWIGAEQADEIMRNILHDSTYNVAVRDLLNESE